MTPTPSPLPAAPPIHISIDWDSFVPDLIVGLFTGLVVGAILAWTQSRAAQKRERREIELRWEALRPRVGALLLDPWDRRVMGSTLAEFARRTDNLRELIKDVPLGSWAEVLDSDELRDLHELSKAAAELHGAAPRFDGFLRHSISRYLVEDTLKADLAEWQAAHRAAELVQPYAVRALFAPTPSQQLNRHRLDIRQDSPVVQDLLAHPPVTYKEVLAMVERAEKHYAACTRIVDAAMTRFWYH
ncbi:hypothetical protein NFX31_06015 [Microbacterium azadirachtae]|uniref:hypothetical protein n=1 Tax=Microbacterium azadirachtae TaxID=582680 RepID=UPI0021D4CA1A|nr:hypothetical protein [Microbacterium azadirachtae]UXW87077.1 hypothetical protein NFX31_06015 [Microbacterium azadirachtae]